MVFFITGSRDMKIGIDISMTIGERAGVGYYAANLVDSLSKIDRTNQYLLYPFFCHTYHPDFKTAEAPREKNFHLHFENIPKKITDLVWHSPVPRKWILGKVDILHSTTFCTPQDHYGKLIVTIFDISFLIVPECHTEANRQHCLKGTLDAVRYADCIIAISDSGKRDLVHYFDADPDQVVVTHLAAKDIFTPRGLDERTQVLEKYRIPGDFIFIVGSYEPRKNIGTLVRAYMNLPQHVKNHYSLVIAGGKGWLNSDIDVLIEAQDTARIRRIGYVDERDLAALYSAATVFVYPSYYEGFGLPILEAMSCGTPVIASNTSSMPEIGSGAALYFDPTDARQLTALLLGVTGDENLQNELSRKGIERAGEFSWDKTARATLKIYEELYSN
jgi:glycosyltransferase involved in cell wall biosynthesis